MHFLAIMQSCNPISCCQVFPQLHQQKSFEALIQPFFQAFLLNEDLGDSLDSVEALLKKHEDFEKSLSAQEEKITVSHHTTVSLGFCK